MPQMAPNGPGGFFPTNPDLADILGRTDLDFEHVSFVFLDPPFWISTHTMQVNSSCSLCLGVPLCKDAEEKAKKAALECEQSAAGMQNALLSSPHDGSVV